MTINTDCRHFDGYKPCTPHKETGTHCAACMQYDPVTARILIIKLGAAGEVIRCTPILRYLRAHHPAAEIVWVTRFRELVPEEWVDRIVPFDWEQVEWLKAQLWDTVYSLDKERGACAVAAQMNTARLKGFTLDPNGNIAPADQDATHKFRTGVFDDLMMANRRHYIDEVFEMCGWRFAGEHYVLPPSVPFAGDPIQSGRPLIGLNTGAGPVWPTRIWPEDHFAALAERLQDSGFQVMLLGGPDEHDLNTRLRQRTGALYCGVRPLRQFLSIVEQCTVVVTSVTMALHMAIGAGRRVVLLNNIFNRHEFHLYGLGEVLEPQLSCLGCYKSSFDAGCEAVPCMGAVTVEDVLAAIVRQVGQVTATPRVPTAGPHSLTVLGQS